MTKEFLYVRRSVFALLAALCLAGVTSAYGKDPAVNPQPVAEAQMQISTEGLTYDQYLVRQDGLNKWLTGEMQAAAFEKPMSVALTPAQINDVEQAPTTPMRIGAVTRVNPLLNISGATAALRPAGDGGYVRTLVITSENAGAIRVHIENMSLPDNASLYLYSRAGEAFGPYTGRGLDGTGEFWTESVFGAEAILQIRVTAPANDATLKQISLSVTEIGTILARFTDHFLRAGFCGNASCIVDASCYNGTPADPSKNAVAKMEWIAGAFIYTCTGGLINDNNPTQNNFFLTANHCLSKSATAKNVQFYWRFATSSCNGACPSNTGWPYKTTGASVSATNRKGDFTLLHLNANPPAGSVSLGWTTTAVATSNGAHLYRISNPQFGPQVYSQHNVDTSAPTCSGWPRGERIYSRDITGAIDGGSSGSPVVNGSSQIVGQLSGSCGTNPSDPCASGLGEANATVDGAFAYYYASVQPILNP